MPEMLEPGPLDLGQPAPDFTLPRDGGGTVALSTLKGQAVILYFYPKDDTPGCTIEAQDFTSEVESFASSGAVILGISKDSVKSHDKFRDKYGLKIALLYDEHSDVCERYGVWAEKSMFGNDFMGIVRSTFLIDKDGTLAHIWRKVTVEGHTDEVLAAVRAL